MMEKWYFMRNLALLVPKMDTFGFKILLDISKTSIGWREEKTVHEKTIWTIALERKW